MKIIIFILLILIVAAIITIAAIYQNRSEKFELEEEIKTQSKLEIVNMCLNELAISTPSKGFKDLLRIHKIAWAGGVRSAKLDDPDIFPKNILDTTLKDIYFSGVFHLSRHSLQYWEDNFKNVKIGENPYGIKKDYKIYDIIYNHYGFLLETEFKQLKQRYENS